MVHLHYSPFQFATEVQASENNVNAKKTVKTLKRMTARDKLVPKLCLAMRPKRSPVLPTHLYLPTHRM